MASLLTIHCYGFTDSLIHVCSMYQAVVDTIITNIYSESKIINSQIFLLAINSLYTVYFAVPINFKQIGLEITLLQN